MSEDDDEEVWYDGRRRVQSFWSLAVVVMPMVKIGGLRAGVAVVEVPRKECLLPDVDLLVFRRLGVHAAEIFDPRWP